MTLRTCPTPELRLMRPDDFHACVQLWRRCEGVVLRDWEDPNALRTLLARNPGGCWVMELSSQVVGAILCGHDGWRGYVYHAAVDPEWQRAGLGSSLVHQAMNYFGQERIRRVHVLVHTGNPHGSAFWRALGATLREDVDVFTIGPPEVKATPVQ